METKICTCCGVEKPLSEYYKEAKGRDGHRGNCKLCHNSHKKIYNQNPIVKERRRVSDLKNYSTLKGKLVQKRKRHKRRAKLKAAGTFTIEEWDDRLIEYNHCCAYCYKPFSADELTIDHMIPLSRGGTNTIDNLVPACRSCNSRKWTKTPLEMLQKGLM
jgi:5-methylcytosine-specific restriction endonuclease McrA